MASATLDNFSTKVVDLERQVSDAAQASINSINDLAQSSTSILQDLGILVDSISMSTVDISTNNINTSLELSKQLDINKKNQAIVIDTAKQFVQMSADLKNSTVELKNHIDINDQFMDGLTEIIDLVRRKNEGHELQNKLLQNDVSSVEELDEVTEDVIQSFTKAKNVVNEIGDSLLRVLDFVKKVDADTERFVTTNYRAYGSQQALVQSSRDLAMATGVLYAEAIKAYSILGNLKAPQEELAKYAEIVARTSRFTGASIEVTATFANRLRIVGYTAEEVERKMVTIGEAMRKYGLNTQEVTTIMNIHANELLRLKSIYGGNTAEIEKFTNSSLIMTGFAKSMGYGADEMRQFEHYLLNNVGALTTLLSTTSTVEAGTDGMRLALLRAGFQMNDIIGAIEARGRAGEYVNDQLIATESNYVNVLFGGNKAAYQAARAQATLAEQYNITGRNIEELNKLTEISKNKLDALAREADYTLTRQLMKLSSTIWSVIGSFTALIADFILPFVYALNQVVTTISWTISSFNGLVSAMERTIGTGGYLVSTLKFITGGALTFITTFMVIPGVFTSIGATITGLIAGITGLSFTLAGLTTSITAALGTITATIATAAATIGSSLVALTSVLRPLMIPILGLSAAFVLATVGAKQLAEAVKTISDTGNGGILALGALTVAVIALGGALVGLGYLAQGPVLAGVLVVSAGMLAVSAAAIAVGYGVSLAADGFVKMAGVLTLQLVTNIALLSATLLGLAFVLPAVTPGLYMLGGAMLAIGVSATILATAFGIIESAFGGIDPEAVLNLGNSFVLAAGLLLTAGTLTLTASAAFATAGVTLAAGTALLLVGGSALVPLGTLLIFGGGLVLTGAGLLHSATVLIQDSSNSMQASGTVLAVASGMIATSIGSLMSSGVSMIAAGPMLLAGSASIVAASFGLSAAAYSIDGIGDRLSGSATTIANSAIILHESSDVLLLAGTNLDFASTLISQAAPKLESAFNDLDRMSLVMAAGAESLSNATNILSRSGDMIILANTKISSSINDLANNSNILATVGSNIMTASTSMNDGAVLLYDAFSTLGDAVSLVSDVLPAIQDTNAGLNNASVSWLLFGNNLNSAGQLISVGGASFYSGILSVVAAVDLINVNADNLISGSAAFDNAVESVSHTAIVLSEVGDSLSTTSYKLYNVAGVMSGVGTILDDSASTINNGANRLNVVVQSLSGMSENLLTNGDKLSVGALAVSNAGAMLLAGGISINESSKLLSDGSIMLGSASSSLVFASNELYNSSVVLTSVMPVYGGAVTQLSNITSSFASSVGDLSDSSTKLASSSAELENGSQKLVVAADILSLAVAALSGAGNDLVPASKMIYDGIAWLEYGIDRFSNTIDRIFGISNAVSSLANSFDSLRSIELGRLAELTNSALETAPNIIKLADAIDVAALRFNDGVLALEGPVNRMVNLISSLQKSMLELSAAANNNVGLEEAAKSFEEYAAILEKASIRVESAVNAKALAVLKSGQQVGVTDAVQSKVISTVKVLNSEGDNGRVSTKQDVKEALLAQQVELLKVIIEKILTLVPGGQSPINEILDLLRNTLPDLANGGGSLDGKMNDWS